MQSGIRSASDPFNIKKRRAWLEVRRNFFSVRVAVSWNSRPTDLKEEKNTEKFRKKYKKLRAAEMDHTQMENETCTGGRERGHPGEDVP